MSTTLEVARTTPPDLFNPDKFVRVRGVPIFDENCRYKRVQKPDGTTEVIKQCVDKEKLEIICRNSKLREEEGNIGLLFIGHTTDDDGGKSEKEQPDKPGFIYNHRLGLLKEGGDKIVNLVDLFIDRNYLAKHKITADELLSEYPRRSAEVVGKMTNLGYIDSVALLKRTPYRNLGLVTEVKEDKDEKDRNQDVDRNIFECTYEIDGVEYVDSIDKNSHACECGGTCTTCSTNKENFSMEFKPQTHMISDEDYERICEESSNRTVSKLKAFFSEVGRADHENVATATEDPVFANSGNTATQAPQGKEKTDAAVGETIKPSTTTDMGPGKTVDPTPNVSKDSKENVNKINEKEKEGLDKSCDKPPNEQIDKNVTGLAQTKLDRDITEGSASPGLAQGLVAGDGKEHMSMGSGAAGLGSGPSPSVPTATNEAPMMADESTEKDTYRLKYEELSKDFNKSLINQLDMTKENELIKAKLKATEAKLADEIDRNRLMNREVTLTKLHDVDKYDFDLEKFKLRVKGKSDEEFDELVDMIKENFNRSIVDAELEPVDTFVDTGAAPRDRAGNLRREAGKPLVDRNRMEGVLPFENGDVSDVNEIMRFAKKNGIKDSEEAVRQYLEAKEANKGRKTSAG